MRQETKHKGRLMGVLRLLEPLGAVARRHEGDPQSGWPDISFTAGGFTTLIEAKHDDLEGFKLADQFSGVQERLCRRLARAGRCLLIVWRGSPPEALEVYDPRRTDTPLVSYKGDGRYELVAHLAQAHGLVEPTGGWVAWLRAVDKGVKPRNRFTAR